MKNAIVLLSAGLDSTVNCYLAKRDYKNITALCFDYGQKASKRELSGASQITKELQISFQSLALPWLKDLSDSALTSSATNLPKNVNLDDLNEIQKSAQTVWVPNRNAIFIHIAAAFAKRGDTDIIVGFNKEEAVTFPDNSEEFVKFINNTLNLSTFSQVQVKSYTLQMNKKEIVQLGKSIGVNFDMIWSCYEGGEKPCGFCESCLRTQAAFDQNSD